METDDGLTKLIFSKEELKNLPHPANQVQQYLQHLGSCGLEKLVKEPERIVEERSSIISQTQELAFQNYPTFIETAQCTQEISSQFKSVVNGAVKLSTNLKVLEEKCIQFSEAAQSLSAARRLTSLALSKHTQLLEILELPQLMDTCVRNGYWEEALELSAHVGRLERKLGYIPLIANIARDVQSCTRLMLSQLIAQLRMPAQLPHCLKVVGYLRRMGVFSEEELRLKFLQARDAWFRATLEEISKDDAYHHVLKTIELSRVHLFDIATQYRAIFTDEDPLVLANQNSNINDSAIFHSWIIQKITDFVLTLQTDLPRVPATSLESVFGQCMYFGLSFGRIGSDFRAFLIPIFTQVVYDRFDQSANKAEIQFADAMAGFSLMQNANLSLVPPLVSAADQIQPPQSLLKFPPLAGLCNGIIAAFNDLRLYAPVQLADPVARKLERTLQNCSQIVSDFYRHEKEAMTPNEEQEFAKFLEHFSKDLIDFIQKMVQLMFPVALMSLQTGFTTSEIQKQALASLKRDSIVQPIVHLLPAKEPLVEHLPEWNSITSPEVIENGAPPSVPIVPEPNPDDQLTNGVELVVESVPGGGESSMKVDEDVQVSDGQPHEEQVTAEQNVPESFESSGIEQGDVTDVPLEGLTIADSCGNGD